MINLSRGQILAIVITILSAIGLYVSLLLTIDKFELLENPNVEFGCGISVKINCVSVMQSDQASAFGFPNSILGIMGYSFMLVTGIFLYIQNFKNKIFLNLFNLGTFLSAIFSFWLLSQSIWVIGSLCPLCLVSWACATGVFLASTLYNIRYQIIPFSEILNWKENRKTILTIFGCIAFLIYFGAVLILFYEYGNEIFKLLNIKVYLP